ncbi:MAG: type III-A CRISPR-associated protein Csm2 [Rhodoferax sp.]|nr:type III-A CRISPR-associated protein Csm2 [Rhodoferax sp.]
MATNYGGGYGQQRAGGPGQGAYDRQSAPTVTITVTDIKLQVPVSVELFASIAEDKAITVARAGGRKNNKSTQLRKFYDELALWFEKVNLERSKDAKFSKYAEVAPFIKMMNAKVAYARGREHVDACFEQMFSHLIRQIDSPETLKHAKLFMEAFMGFYKVHEEK